MVKGVVRSIDDLGRIVIPKEIRRSLKIDPYTSMDIYLNGTTICMEKANAVCVCCGLPETEAELRDYKGVLMCPDCHPDAAGEGGGQ